MMARTTGKREAKRSHTGLGRRVLSAFLAAVMSVSLLQVGVLAAEETPAEKQAKEQIQGFQDGNAAVYYTYNPDSGKFEGDPDTEFEVKNNPTDPKVTISKEIAATGEENEFDITLKVVTEEAIEESTKSPDAAVVLVIDVSGSMDRCVNCGEEDHHEQDCTYRKSGRDVTTSQTRLYHAKDAAKSFLRTYAGFSDDKPFKAPNARREVAIVAYSKSAQLIMPWKDVNATSESKAEELLSGKGGVYSYIDSLKADGKTNIDAGLKVAEKDLLPDVSSGANKVDNRFVVLLTDGQPNENTGDNIESYGKPDTYTLRGSKDYDNPAYRANYIRTQQGATFYSVCLSAGDSIFNWMSSYSNKCVNANNADQLSLAFKEIIIRMMLAVDAWKVEDVMGSYILLDPVEDSVYDFKDHTQGEDGAPGAVYQSVKTVDGKSVKVLNWDLRKDLMSKSTTIKKNGTILDDKNGYDPSDTKSTYEITYTLKYKVKLDVASLITDVTAANPGKTNAELKALVEAQWNKTNGETRLDYYLTRMNTETKKQEYVKDDGTTVIDVSKGEDPMLHQYFKVPAVKGYAADLGFTKKGADGKTLDGVQFSMTREDKKWSQNATSGNGGVVEFPSLIPSGATYTLSETIPEDANGVYGKYETVPNETFILSYGTGLPSFAGGELEDPLYIPKTDVPFTKSWLVPNGVTPDSITVTLLRNGNPLEGYVNRTIRKSDCTVDSNGVWSYTFEDLPTISATGDPYTYGVKEVLEPNSGYEVLGDGTLELTNRATGKVNIVVTKDWILPDTMNTTTATVDIILKANGTEVQRERDVCDGQTVSFMKVDKYDEYGQTIIYTVDEDGGSANTPYQQAEIRKIVESGPTTMYTIFNTVTQEYDASASGSKIWKDNGDESARPEKITVELYADGKPTGKTQDVTAANDWQYTFSGLQRYNFIRDNAGRIIGVQEIVYTVKEVGEYEGYSSSAAGKDVINTRTGTVSFTVKKTWAADVAGADHGEVTAILYANGHPVEEATFEDEYTFTGLDKYDTDGVAIKYDVIEKPVNGYTASYSDVTTTSSGGYTQTITNRRDDADDTITITVTKVWKQPGDAKDKTATFQLIADGEEPTKFVTITGNGVNYFRGLPRYEEIEGTLREIDYDVEEIDIPKGYKQTLAEKLKPDSAGNFTCNFINTITGTTKISVSKSWVKPSSVTAPDITISVQSYSFDDSDWVTLDEPIKIKSGESSGEMKDLPAYDRDGRRISYRISEDSVPGYSSAINGGYDSQSKNYEYSIVNTINAANVDVTVSKTWIDGSRDASERPSVTLQLLRDGMAFDTVEFWYNKDTGKVMATTKYDTVEATVSEDGNTYSLTLTLPVYSADRTVKYTYSVDEWNTPAGYTKNVSGTTVTNKRVGTLEPITITKYWTDPAGTNRPDITLVLKGTDGSERNILVSDDDGVTATLNGKTLEVSVNGSTWSIQVPDLPEFDDKGAKITYTLDENDVSGYTKETVEGQPFAIRNVIEQKSDVSAGATKEWVMDTTGHYKAVYPESITVALFRDGQMVEGSKQTVNRTDSNTYPIKTYEGLKKYASDGHVYKYEVLELDANGAAVKDGGTVSFGENNEYTVTYKDDVITNTYKAPAKYLYQVVANYVHKSYDGNLISQYLNVIVDSGTETESKTVTVDPDDYKVCQEDNGLTYKFDAENPGNVLSVELVKENHLYKLVLNYVLVDEKPEEPVKPPVGGDDTFTLNVQKVWKGDNAEDRPESITVQLLKDGKAYSTLELSASKNWKGRWVDLSDKYNWTVEEMDVPDGYSSEVSVRNNTWTITNTYDGGSVIPEEPVPGGDQPAIPGDGDGEIIIPDTDVPTGDKTTNPPKTGDAMGLWAAMAALSGAGLGWVTLSNKKRKDEEA